MTHVVWGYVVFYAFLAGMVATAYPLRLLPKRARDAGWEEGYEAGLRIGRLRAHGYPRWLSYSLHPHGHPTSQGTLDEFTGGRVVEIGE